MPAEDGYRIGRRVRERCVFAQHDVTRDPPLPGLDLVCWSNLVTYSGPVLKDRIAPLLRFAVKDRGFLFLGAASGLDPFPGFTLVDGKYEIYVRTKSGDERNDFTSVPPHAHRSRAR